MNYDNMIVHQLFNCAKRFVVDKLLFLGIK